MMRVWRSSSRPAVPRIATPKPARRRGRSIAAASRRTPAQRRAPPQLPERAGPAIMSAMAATASRPSIVVIGGGFGGLQATLKLARAPVDVTMVDRRNFHLFQPLAYQVATGALSAAEVAQPLRSIFKRHPNVRVVLAEATGFDLQARV